MAHYQVKHLPTEYDGFNVTELAIYRGHMCRLIWDTRGEDYGQSLDVEMNGKWVDGFNEWDDMLEWLDRELDATDYDAENDWLAYAEEHRLRSYQLV